MVRNPCTAAPPSQAPRRAGALAALMAAVLAGCGGLPTEVECDAMSAGKARDDCYSLLVRSVCEADLARCEAFVEKIGDPVTRDFAWHQVTREIDPGSDRWCNKIEEPALKSRCKTLVSRPHLHREMVRQAGGNAEPGPPPPGGPGGGLGAPPGPGGRPPGPGPGANPPGPGGPPQGPPPPGGGPPPPPR